MVFDPSIASAASGRTGALQGVLSTAIASVTEACGRLGFGDAKPGSLAHFYDAPREVPRREEWASISGDVVSGAENAAFAAGLHHQAAAELDHIEQELRAIKSLMLPRS